MIGNFFQVTCPLLYELNTIAYFALFRNAHNYSTIARIRETTQLLLDIYSVKGNYYIHPLKAWQRYSPTMFLPHLIDGQDAICITSSAHAPNYSPAIAGAVKNGLLGGGLSKSRRPLNSPRNSRRLKGAFTAPSHWKRIKAVRALPKILQPGGCFCKLPQG